MYFDEQLLFREHTRTRNAVNYTIRLFERVVIIVVSQTFLPAGLPYGYEKRPQAYKINRNNCYRFIFLTKWYVHRMKSMEKNGPLNS